MQRSIAQYPAPLTQCDATSATPMRRSHQSAHAAAEPHDEQDLVFLDAASSSCERQRRPERAPAHGECSGECQQRHEDVLGKVVVREPLRRRRQQIRDAEHARGARRQRRSSRAKSASGNRRDAQRPRLARRSAFRRAERARPAGRAPSSAHESCTWKCGRHSPKFHDEPCAQVDQRLQIRSQIGAVAQRVEPIEIVRESRPQRTARRRNSRRQRYTRRSPGAIPSAWRYRRGRGRRSRAGAR